MTILNLTGYVASGLAGWYIGARGVEPLRSWREAAFSAACGIAAFNVVQLVGAAL